MVCAGYAMKKGPWW